jgi:hypothetical protein
VKDIASGAKLFVLRADSDRIEVKFCFLETNELLFNKSDNDCSFLILIEMLVFI